MNIHYTLSIKAYRQTEKRRSADQNRGNALGRHGKRYVLAERHHQDAEEKKPDNAAVERLSCKEMATSYQAFNETLERSNKGYSP
jgi:hypothetical protein